MNLKMEWLKEILPLIGVFIGWLLSEKGKILSDERQDKRKLNRLLFYLLEIRFHLSREYSIELSLEKCMNILNSKLKEKFSQNISNEELQEAMKVLKPLIQQSLSNQATSNLANLGSNIDEILNELAEVLPILAYELNGKHNIKERLNAVNSFFTGFESLSIEKPFDLKGWIQPKLTENLLKDIDDSIITISEKINRKTKTEILIKMQNMNSIEDDPDMGHLMEELLQKVSER